MYTLFLQSEVQDPYALYENMRREYPVYWDSPNRLWAVYSYEGCKTILNNTDALIPLAVQQNKDGLSECASQVVDRLARLSNGAQHEVAKQTVLLLFDNMKTIDVAGIARGLLLKERETDWVNAVCRKLPVIAVAHSFGFDEKDTHVISEGIGRLITIMLPGKTAAQAKDINDIVQEIYGIAEKQLLTTGFYKSMRNTLIEKYHTGEQEAAVLFISNLIGLFIQSYDACRGLLSNALLQMFGNKEVNPGYFTNESYLEKIVTETLRFDPPVQHTRRLAGADILLNNIGIKKGDAILVVLAAANRDTMSFSRPGIFDTERMNNNRHLTFGIGGHRCPANRFSIGLCIKCLLYFFSNYKTIKLLQKDIQYEPLMNVRLPKNIFISLQ